MKELTAKLASLPDKAIAVLGVIGTLIVSGLLLLLVAWPSFGSLGKVATEIEAENTKLTVINQSIDVLSKEDKGRLEKLTKFLERLVPEKVNNLHFATLNELVAQAAGTTVNSIQISKGSPPKAGTSTTVTTAPGVKTSGEAAPSIPVQTSQVAAVSVAVTYSSGFDSLLNLIKFWALADQLVGIKDINVSGLDGSLLNYTINYELPTSPVVQKATIAENILLTEDQKRKIEDLKTRIIYTATPSANPVGKSNPFN